MSIFSCCMFELRLSVDDDGQWESGKKRENIEWSHRGKKTEMYENDAFIVFTAQIKYDEYQLSV